MQEGRKRLRAGQAAPPAAGNASHHDGCGAGQTPSAPVCALGQLPQRGSQSATPSPASAVTAGLPPSLREVSSGVSRKPDDGGSIKTGDADCEPVTRSLVRNDSFGTLARVRGRPKVAPTGARRPPVAPSIARRSSRKTTPGNASTAGAAVRIGGRGKPLPYGGGRGGGTDRRATKGRPYGADGRRRGGRPSNDGRAAFFEKNTQKACAET